ncbi:hypothetical protein ARMGADRAFT_792128 [Armillaria gallica]|uniref:Uncharacterized protein n=1 Tax=Armillaria gallica TaxID=47427 RepID=A0A2H3DJ48_ARMGA|nr:hypothetical protein ARMGADRAFT_792128 [Armillaria gallica]
MRLVSISLITTLSSPSFCTILLRLPHGSCTTPEDHGYTGIAGHGSGKKVACEGSAPNLHLVLLWTLSRLSTNEGFLRRCPPIVACTLLRVIGSWNVDEEMSLDARIPATNDLTSPWSSKGIVRDLAIMATLIPRGNSDHCFRCLGSIG